MYVSPAYVGGRGSPCSLCACGWSVLWTGSNYGAVLDMVTDRCSTAGLLVVLSHLYPKYMLVFLYLLILDFSSHWYHMYSSKGHHKSVAGDRNLLLRLYYGVYPFFGYCCVGTELFYILLYVLHFDPLYVIPGINVPLQQVRGRMIATS
jgi:CDP-diacylglycerol--inositol 3-phosphatidyltransferase